MIKDETFLNIKIKKTLKWYQSELDMKTKKVYVLNLKKQRIEESKLIASITAVLETARIDRP
ncbi:MAG: hypothetical protein WCF23_06520 [Candidatus Nitrosopolaris sp.]